MSHARNPGGGCHGRGEIGNIHWAAISTHIVLSRTELTAFCGNFLEIFLGWSIGIANLQKETLFANGLSMV